MSGAAKIIEHIGGVQIERNRAPFLHNRMERLAARANIKKPLVYVIQDDAPNACAVSLSTDDAAVAVTAGLLRHLDESEIEAVLAHEVGHIQKGHSKTKTLVALKALAIELGANVVAWQVASSDPDFTPDDEDPDDLASSIIKLAVAVLVKGGGDIAASSMLTAASFDTEFEADECGGQLSRKPWALANALRRIEALAVQSRRQYEPEVSQLFIMSAASSDSPTHPPTDQRVMRLEAMSAQRPLVATLPTIFCSSCGEKTDADGSYCYWCGCELDAAAG